MRTDTAEPMKIGASDVRAIALSGVVVLDTLGVVGLVGGESLFWLALLSLLFVAPYALLVAELGSAFPAEGGPYAWVRLAFGRPAGALCALLYWVATPIWLGGTLAIVAVSVFESFLAQLGGARWAFALAFVWLAIGAASVDLRRVSWVPATGAIVRVALLTLLSGSTVIYGVAHGLHGISARELEPTWPGLVAALPVLLFGLLGLELPSTLGRELRNPARDVPAGVARVSLMSIALYAAPLAALLVVLPVRDRAGIGGFIDAIRTVFTVYGGQVDVQGVPHLSGAGTVLGDLASLGFIYALLTGAATWLIGGNRVLAAAAADGAAPRILGRRSTRSGAPVAACILAGVTASAVLTLTYELAPGRFGRYLAAMVGVAVSTVLLSYLLVFPSLLRLRRTHAGTPRPFSVPGGAGGVWACTILTTAGALFVAVQLLYPGLGLPHPDTMLPAAFEGLRRRYEEAVVVPIAGCLTLAAVGWLIARREAQASVSDV
jgi:glutamate:GABA antiporter